MTRAKKPARFIVVHTGKVSRLPLAVRVELNRRLFRGDDDANTLAWLHADPAAKATLEAQFGGSPVTPGQLALWRRTGYAEWAAAEDRKARRLAPLKQAMAAADARDTTTALAEATRQPMRVESVEVRPSNGFLWLIVDGLPAEVPMPDFRLLALGIVIMRGGPPHSIALFPCPKRLAALLPDATDDPVIVELARRQLDVEHRGYPRAAGPRVIPSLEEAKAARWKIMPKAQRIEMQESKRRGGGAAE